MAKIVILRPVSELALNQSVLQEMEVIRVVDAAAATCKIEIPAQDMRHQAQLVNKQIPSIVAHGNRGSPAGVLPIKLAPKFTPAPWQARFEMELRCITDDCEKFEISNCVVTAKGKSAIPVPQGK